MKTRDTITINAPIETGKWQATVFCHKWHEKLRFNLAFFLLRSLKATGEISHTRIDIGG